jgi:hypothetical protein
MGDAKVRGTVHLIEETKTFGQKGFRKRMVVLEQEKGSFTNYVPLEFTRDACDSVDQLQVGDEVEVEYFLNGRKWQRDAQSEVKYFVNVEATGFKLIGEGDSSSGRPSGGGAPAGRASSSGGPRSSSSRASANDAFAEAVDDEEPPF